MTQKDLDAIKTQRLENYIRDGETPPSQEFVKEVQKRWRWIAEDEKTTTFEDQTVYGKEGRSVLSNPRKFAILFDANGNSISGLKFSKSQYAKQINTSIVGKDYSKK